MAFTAVNGYDVEHASSLLVYENLFPEIQHINGKGVTDKYTPSDRVESVTYIDVMRVLPYAPRFRQLGGTANGGFSNVRNNGRQNAPQSTHYTIPVDLIYDEGVPITDVQIYSNPVALKQVVLAQLVKTAGMAINIITYAKQLEGYFRNGDNFDKALAHVKGSIVAADVLSTEIAEAVYQYTGGTDIAGKFIEANASLDEGIPEIGALTVPVDERQAFVSPSANALLKSQYLSNASEASARILATGFRNPFTNTETARIDSRTGLCGTFDGVDCFLFNKATKKFVYVALGVSSNTTVTGYLDQIGGIIVYGAGTCRGIVGPQVMANVNPYYGGVYLLPKMKVGVEVLHGSTIKLLVDAGASSANAWTAAKIAAIMNAVTFTPIDGATVTGTTSGDGFNDGTTV